MNENEKQPVETQEPVETPVETQEPQEDQLGKTYDDQFNSELSLKVDETHKDVGAVLDAVKELTKTTAELVKQVQLLRKSGKF